jgi:UDP-N-acetylmuramoyl-tripeptide--D-alanyl-D-alanine ligase
MITLAQAQALLPGSELHAPAGRADVTCLRVHTDTRSLRPGDLFVALRGERFDAHTFIDQAQAAGAVAALVDHVPAGTRLPCLQVADTLQALQQLATAWRLRYAGPLLAVTGSNGKTTVTQMIAAILRAWVGDAGTLATAGNFNNHIGVPLTLLRLRPEGAEPHRAAVLELGMNHPGEIALLAAMARPTVALVNNAQREHQEFMASVEAVARENGSVIEALPPHGIAVLPAADAFLPLWRDLAGERRVWTFGLQAHAEADALHVHAEAFWQPADAAWVLHLHTPGGAADTTLALAGRHNVANAAAAAACALAAGAPLAAVALGLARFEPVAGRSHTLRLQRAGQAVTLIDDSYNANPDSVRAAIDVLASLPGPRWLLLGDMGEVGSQGPQFHAEVGAHARASGIETVWAAGALCARAGAHRHFASVAELLQALPQGPAAASMLVKGSRFMKMEQVVQALATPLLQGGRDAA